MMGTYVHVAGWLELDQEALDKALAIIEEDLDQLGHYTGSWCLQRQGGGGSRHLFFGCDVREQALPAWRAQLSRLASQAISQDGDITDYPNGVFQLAHEREDIPKRILYVLDGQVRDT